MIKPPLASSPPPELPIPVRRLPSGFTLLQVTPALEGGGVERVTLDIARMVVEAGGRAIVASRGGRLEGELTAAGGTLARLPVESRNPLVMAGNVARLTRLMRAEGVSVVHVRSRAPAFSAIAAARALGVPVVATYHGIYSANGPVKRWYNAVMTRGDLTLANSQFTRDHVMAQHHLAPQRLAVAPEGIDTDLFDPARVTAGRTEALRAAWGLGPDETRPILLLAARLTGWKGQGVMIEALARMRPERRPLLILAGKAESPGQAAALKAAAAQAGVGDNVRLVGAVDDMPAAFALADLVAAPSTLPESFGRGVAEAGAMRRPVLASPLGGPAETVVDGQTGWLVPAGDAEAWARAVETALALPPEARARMGEAARTRIVRHYSLAVMARRTFTVYRHLLRRLG